MELLEIINAMKNRVFELKRRNEENKKITGSNILNEMNEREIIENNAVIKELQKWVKMAESFNK